ncbi:hypothetical protein [Legionella rubrilucens]|uniref:hypothetical protein n=1 Tax=Legionella rubrilucens TaxID=458 RepID=UPI0010565F83|nr:hypothetical protein [Legionella rubrilucens]
MTLPADPVRNPARGGGQPFEARMGRLGTKQAMAVIEACAPSLDARLRGQDKPPSVLPAKAGGIG